MQNRKELELKAQQMRAVALYSVILGTVAVTLSVIIVPFLHSLISSLDANVKVLQMITLKYILTHLIVNSQITATLTKYRNPTLWICAKVSNCYYVVFTNPHLHFWY
ncbi:unnamed protein product [Gongylonema pulchrum]|uniref:Col_cuticle_N domain-containing protein n=1 Tax=Gongylonema pulchrum TaxID=637853 RepID=A0A183E340_9BILA|nr:unnamed protein product [Gongylonema pulchrum]